MLKEILKRIYYPIYTLFRFPKEYKTMNRLSNLQMEKKAFIQQLFDMLYFSFIYGEYFDHYYLAKLNYKKYSVKDFIGGSLYRRLRDNANYRQQTREKGYSSIVLLRDKSIFERWMKINDIPVVESEVVAMGSEFKKYDLNLFESNYFAKPLEGEQGQSIVYIDHQDKLQELKDNQEYIIQKEIIQHDFLNTIYSDSLNTVRIVTYIDSGEVKILSAAHRFGTDVSKKVDNWSAGGIIFPIDIKTGRYKEHGIVSNNYLQYKEDFIFHISHPTTKRKVVGESVPYWKKVRELTVKAHTTLPHIKSIGWDVVITSKGIILLEGNDNWSLGIVQCAHGGMKERILNIFSKE